MTEKYQAKAYFLTARLPLSAVMSLAGLGAIKKKEKSFVLFALSEQSYLYVKDYGGVTFFNVDDSTITTILAKLRDLVSAELSEATEQITVVADPVGETEGFDELLVKGINEEVVHIVCLNLAQSAALFHYQELSDQLLEDTRLYTNELETKGKVSLSRKRLMKYIGSTLNIKNKISENLYIFDTPMLAYENEQISRIDEHLKDDLEMKYRYNAIKEQLNIIHENLDLFKDMSMHQHSSNLEWIIIWLILFEVVHVIIDQIL